MSNAIANALTPEQYERITSVIIADHMIDVQPGTLRFSEGRVSDTRQYGNSSAAKAATVTFTEAGTNQEFILLSTAIRGFSMRAQEVSL
ncbi:hypothetical protein [Streptomyces albidoflavus]|uniref:hypothetical protein n=1 Tax=Streptomyces albidoflavus TaxID=1886 RepID=UPI0033F6BE85